MQSDTAKAGSSESRRIRTDALHEVEKVWRVTVARCFAPEYNRQKD